MSDGNNWEKDVLTSIATEGIKEQRRSRRWGIFFKLLGFTYLFILLFIMSSSSQDGHIKGGKHTALIDLKGVIAPGSEGSADNIIAALRSAFEDKTQWVLFYASTVPAAARCSLAISMMKFYVYVKNSQTRRCML